MKKNSMKNKEQPKQIVIKGQATAPGIAVGPAFVFKPFVLNLAEINSSAESVASEFDLFESARLKVLEQLNFAHKQSNESYGNEFSEIFESQIAFLNDKVLQDEIKAVMKEGGNSAGYAVSNVLSKKSEHFINLENTYFRERAFDIIDLKQKLLLSLFDIQVDYQLTHPSIVIAESLSPTDTVNFNRNLILGFLTDRGGQTSHSAILARGLRIPSVVNGKNLSEIISSDDLLIIDGFEGTIIINPDDDEIIRYQERQLYHEKYESSILKDSHLPSETTDSHRVTIKANIEFLEEIDTAKELVTEGIGLYRTEFLYLRQKRIPGEDELFDDYREVVEQMSPSPVTIRTLDIGGDKFPSEILMPGETNPALGLRSIRFCLGNPEIFRSQLRAILRASAFGRVRLMFPMISGLQELFDAKKVLQDVMDELDSRNIAYDKNIAIGIMIEIPSAAAIADILAKHVDFFSIGTNDLIQYSLAIDRTNEHVAHIYRPYHPGIIRMINFVAKCAKDAGIDVSLCGEMASDPMCVPILLGTGIDELSINTEGIPLIKSVIRSLSRKEAMEDLEELLTLPTSKDIRRFLEKRIEGVMPKIIENGLQENIS